MTRINGRDVVLVLDGTDVSDQVSTVTFGPGTKQTFAQQRGRVPTVLNMTVIQDDAAGTVYTTGINATGGTITGALRPHGNTTASAALPHYTFTATPAGPNGDTVIGGDASDDPSEGLTVEMVWTIAGWTKVTA